MDRALLVGINAYPGNELRGCLNDIQDMAELITKHCGFSESEVRLLTDARATTVNIMKRLRWLTGGLHAGDRVLFHYSGHGAQFPVRDPSGHVTRIDECICPVDFDWSIERTIRDKQFYELFSNVPAGVEFVWVSDSCFSGDLAKSVHRAKSIAPPPDIAWRLRSALAAKVPHLGFVHAMSNFHVALVSGCSKTQTSADAVFNNKPNGALTYFFLQQLTAGGLQKPLTDVVDAVRHTLKKEAYQQTPQLEGATEVMARPFLAKAAAGGAVAA